LAAAAALIYLDHPAIDTDPAHWRQARDLILRAKPYWAAFNAAVPPGVNPTTILIGLSG
jgi:hypothetical protein